MYVVTVTQLGSGRERLAFENQPRVSEVLNRSRFTNWNDGWSVHRNDSRADLSDYVSDGDILILSPKVQGG